MFRKRWRPSHYNKCYCTGTLETGRRGKLFFKPNIENTVLKMLMFRCHLLSGRNILRKGVCIDGDPRGPRGFQPLVWLLQKNSFHSFQDFRLIDPSKKSGPLVQIFTCIYLTICWQVNIPIWKYALNATISTMQTLHCRGLFCCIIDFLFMMEIALARVQEFWSKFMAGDLR